jgi:hypothetical protein
MTWAKRGTVSNRRTRAETRTTTKKIGNPLLGSCAVYSWLEPTFRRNVSPSSSGQVNRDENIVSRCLQRFGRQERSTYIVSWSGGAGEWEIIGEVGFE